MTSSSPQLAANDLLAHVRTQLDALCAADKHRLQGLVRHIEKRLSLQKPCDRDLDRLRERLDAALARIAERIRTAPTPSFDDALPISAKRDEIKSLIEANQVVILAGETGSGKTTQLPKICLELGRGLRGMIGHTQPRRIAARTVASRIADELQVQLGSEVGYQVRFTDHSNLATHIKLMTDGILLAEIQQDPMLFKYDTLIIDEAHERSLNIDFLLGYLKGVLAQRPELKLIVTSATIDLQKFAAHFSDKDGKPAPVIEVSGRTYPVETLYRPWDDDYQDVNEAIVGAIEEILTMPNKSDGDILVFLSGEREIREASHAIKKADFRHLEILPLYARLSLAEQNRVFQAHRGRRVVLATNVAETSLTVPGIGYVIDPGRARISRYSVRTKVQRLPIEAISQASANQRKGRCGRVSNGVCIRLYDEADFLGRPEFTDPEIQRTNLAAVVLQMLQLRIGDVRKFDFVDRPENRLINDGFKLLEEIQAVDRKGKITALGRQLYSLPLDPRFARIILAGAEHNCLREILIIVSGLSIQDPRDRPAEKRQAADEKHRRFWDENSDFLGFYNLWNYIEEQRQELSQNQLQKLCKKEFINYLRVREWRDLHHQLRLAIKGLGLKENADPANYESVHRALVVGLLSNLGVKQEETAKPGNKKDGGGRHQQAFSYHGSRNRRFQIFPGSSQFKKRPKWLAAAEFIETTQLYAHMAAKVEPRWALDAAEHLVKHHYHEPFYDATQGQVMAYDRITLFGLPLVEKQRVQYSKINRQESREVFIRQALVEGHYWRNKRTKKPVETARENWQKANQYGAGDLTAIDHFFVFNEALSARVESLEAKSRRRDILVDDQVVFAFYDAVLPADISNLASFEHWRKQEEKTNAQLLRMDQESLMLHGAGDITGAQFPDAIELDGVTLPLRYHFEPGDPDDGVSVCVPVDFLHMVPESRLQWLVPGLLREKCIALVKALPKPLRKQLVPVPQFVDRALARLAPGNQPLTTALAAEFRHLANIEIPDDAWQTGELDPFYRMNIQVVDDRGAVIDRSRDIVSLKEQYRSQVKKSLRQANHALERDGITQWDFTELPSQVTIPRNGVEVKGFPALVDMASHVKLTVVDNPLDARRDTRRGILRLAALELSQTVKYLSKQLLKGRDLGLAVLDIGTRDQVIEDIIFAAIQRACFDEYPWVAEQQAFKAKLDQGRSELVSVAQEYEGVLAECLALAIEIRKAMKSNRNALLLAFTFGDIQHQLQQLFAAGFMADTPWQWLQHYPRYLQAILVRMEKAPQNPQRDRVQCAALETHWQRHEDLLQKVGRGHYTGSPAWQEYRWMMEELRVSLFAQTLKTLMPVSDKRLNNQWQKVLTETAQ
ncbi:ATP-dependent RNA helicase HrpA [Teredinibacter turnerae]|uniref:ATP-dependent RNA helicase HrpA n=1 Tax=Teredinibacter turnerae TaxID=2426 RepID=UPI0003672A2C|nr:ATP-dependent RNA helicase HrpA [Teredinibacter turnerae]